MSRRSCDRASSLAPSGVPRPWPCQLPCRASVMPMWATFDLNPVPVPMPVPRGSTTAQRSPRSAAASAAAVPAGPAPSTTTSKADAEAFVLPALADGCAAELADLPAAASATDEQDDPRDVNFGPNRPKPNDSSFSISSKALSFNQRTACRNRAKVGAISAALARPAMRLDVASSAISTALFQDAEQFFAISCLDEMGVMPVSSWRCTVTIMLRLRFSISPPRSSIRLARSALPGSSPKQRAARFCSWWPVLHTIRARRINCCGCRETPLCSTASVNSLTCLDTSAFAAEKSRTSSGRGSPDLGLESAREPLRASRYRRCKDMIRSISALCVSSMSASLVRSVNPSMASTLEKAAGKSRSRMPCR
mmetsp:Transcript_49416/g.92651  ORF Transcript_49416/g.92651 Transcript_49416/m.92651 type:complete len:365 (+) Transcript_49416:768-1862(+)